ncbi:MAG: hypothetical protein UZ14_CFX002001772 [Chloroflexi bacterium OLB14]|nr:MAG: hypothetical protein UZ14_CFX002001772 [Chloroflexi bacterium OLB14]
MTKKVNLNNIKKSKINIKNHNTLLNAPSSIAREDVEYLLSNLEEVEVGIDTGDSITYKDTAFEETIKSLERVITKTLDEKKGGEAEKLLTELKNQKPGVNIDKITDLLNKLMGLLKLAGFAAPVIEKFWVVLSKYFGLN